MISLVIVGVLFVLVVVFCVLSAKQWHWANIVFLILCYLAGVAAAAGSAKVLDKRRKVLARVKASEMKLFGSGKDSDGNGLYDEVDANGKVREGANMALLNQESFVRYGAPDTPSYSPDSLRGLSERYRLQMMGRGRLWASGKVTVDGDNRVFTFAEARPVFSEDETIKKPVIVGAEVYAFVDSAVEQGTIYPTRFVGAMRVSSETPEAWILEPEFIASPQDYNNVDVTWSLFEKMPVDRHDTFRNMENFDISEDAQQSPEFLANLTAFRQQLEQSYLPALAVGFAIDSADDEIRRQAEIDYERFIDKIAFDGLGFGRIEAWVEQAQGNGTRKSGDFIADPSEILFKYRLIKGTPAEKPYIVNATGSIEAEGTFNVGGQAIDPALHIEDDAGQILLKEGDVILVDSANANGYQLLDGSQIEPFKSREQIEDQGDNQERVFVRRLFDFPQLLEDLNEQSGNLAESNEELESKIAEAETNFQKISDQERKRLEITAKLEADKKVLTDDEAIIADLLTKAEAQAQTLRDEIARVKRQLADRRAASE